MDSAIYICIYEYLFYLHKYFDCIDVGKKAHSFRIFIVGYCISRAEKYLQPQYKVFFFVVPGNAQVGRR